MLWLNELTAFLLMSWLDAMSPLASPSAILLLASLPVMQAPAGEVSASSYVSSQTPLSLAHLCKPCLTNINARNAKPCSMRWE